MPAWADEEQSSLSEQLSKNANYTFESSLARFNRNYSSDTRHVDDSRIESWNRLQIESKAPLTSGVDLSFKAFGILSTQEDERHGIFSYPKYRQDRLREFDFTELKIRSANDA